MQRGQVSFDIVSEQELRGQSPLARPVVKKPRPAKRPPPKPRNVAAKALNAGQFQPRVEDDPKAYKRRPRHKPDPMRDAADDPGDEPQ